MQNLEDFENQDHSLRERNLKKAEIIINEFSSDIELVKKLKERVLKLKSIFLKNNRD
jgi:hypothetical protein